MECKFFISFNSFFICHIKVEPYWNVNNGTNYTNVANNGIKVEPYWNVNFKILFDTYILVTIKVEPYWNVNGIGIGAKLIAILD